MTAIENAQIKELTDKINEQNSSIKEIKDALLGNEYNEDGGLLKRFSVLETKVTRLENTHNKLLWTGSILVGLGVVIEAAYQVLNILNFMSHVKK